MRDSRSIESLLSHELRCSTNSSNVAADSVSRGSAATTAPSANGLHDESTWGVRCHRLLRLEGRRGKPALPNTYSS